MVQLENAGTTQLIFFFEHCFRAYGGMGWFTESNLLTTSYGKQLQYIIKHICNTFCQFSGCVRACVRACVVYVCMSECVRACVSVCVSA